MKLHRLYAERKLQCGRRARRCAAGVVCAAAICPQAFATKNIDPPQRQSPNQLKQLSLAELGDVEVTTVAKLPEEVWHTPAAVFVLTQDDIRRSGASSIPELLRLVPGVDVAREQSDQWSVGIRGFNSQFSKGLLVLIDGRSVYTPLFEGVYWDVQDVVLDDIDRVEVIRGPGGTIWGANAVNGVINIITKKAADTQGGLVRVAAGGPVDRFDGQVRWGASPLKISNSGSSPRDLIVARNRIRAAIRTITGTRSEADFASIGNRRRRMN